MSAIGIGGNTSIPVPVQRVSQVVLLMISDARVEKMDVFTV